MTQDEQMDRLERALRRFLTTPIRESSEHRESRKFRMTADMLGVYVKALRERDSAKQALDAKPSDSKAQAVLHKAQAILDHARNELRR